IRLPPQSRQVDHEAELAAVSGPPGAPGADRGAAQQASFGWTCANDVTARDPQRSDAPGTRAKGLDSFSPLGRWVSTGVDVSDREVRCEVNGEVRQLGRTSEMVFAPATLVSYVSHIMALLPGDGVLRGTPAGVGPLRPGDRVVVRIDGVGELANPVV